MIPPPLRALLLLFTALLLCACDGHWEEVEQTTGYKGAARVNPFLAAERLLDALGHHAHGSKSLVKMPSHDAVILISGEGGLPATRARQLLRWSFSGGHLIYCLSGARPYNDFGSPFGSYVASMLLDEEKDPVLEQLGVGVLKRIQDDAPPPDAQQPEQAADEDEGEDEDAQWLEPDQKLTWNGSTYQLSLGGFQHMILKRKLRHGEFSAGSKNESLALHLQHGMGTVTLLAHARPFRNHWIGDLDHARWLAALVGLHGSREVLFVSNTAVSFYDMLWQRGWMALVTLAACLLFWLWRQMPRFGPLAEVELDSTRHFASHIAALGEFFWRMRRSPLLVQAARDAVWERVRERHRSLDDGTRQVSDPLATEIARRTDLPLNRVTAALAGALPASAHAFVNLMRDLQTIRRAL